jgi:hypothetical protein
MLIHVSDFSGIPELKVCPCDLAIGKLGVAVLCPVGTYGTVVGVNKLTYGCYT